MIFVIFWGFLLLYNFYNSLNTSSDTSIFSLVLAMISSMLFVHSIFKYKQKRKIIKDSENE